MINYSITMRSVNANLFEINQAKSRINKAKKEGKEPSQDDLGDFTVSLSSKGAETAEKFSAQNITDVKVVWEPGAEFKTLLADAEFNLVASRKAQDAVIKAIKAGESTVDLTNPETPAAPDENGTQGGGTTPGEGTQNGGTQSGGGDQNTSGDDDMGD